MIVETKVQLQYKPHLSQCYSKNTCCIIRNTTATTAAAQRQHIPSGKRSYLISPATWQRGIQFSFLQFWFPPPS